MIKLGSLLQVKHIRCIVIFERSKLDILGSPDLKRVRDIWVFEMRMKKDTTPDLLIVGRLSEDGKRLAGKSAELDEQ